MRKRRASMAGVRARKDSGLAIAAAALGLAGVLALGLFLPVKGLAQETTRADAGGSNGAAAHAFGPLFDAVVERTVKSFWDKDLLASSGWERRAAELRKSVLDAPNHAEAARRINGLLGELKSSHTGLLTPEDVEYYILLDVFANSCRSGSGEAVCAMPAPVFSRSASMVAISSTTCSKARRRIAPA